ncbi:MAG TPA: thioesterase family protein [Pseudolabrys sp.]|nr:thioesterase family protein [Pseudolabrys sp.]
MTGLRYNAKCRKAENDVAGFTYTRRLTIEWGQCDPAGIVFNGRFFEMFDVSTWRLFQAALGVEPHRLSTMFGIVGIPLVDVQANFIRPTKFGDSVEITSWMGEIRRSSFDVEHRLAANGELTVEGSETRVWAVRSKEDPERIAGAPIPDEVVAKFRSVQSFQ